MKSKILLLIVSFMISINCMVAQDSWTQKANFGGTIRYSGSGFSIGNKGYMGTGYGQDGNKNDFWEFDPVTNIWSQKADFSGGARNGAAAFCIGSKGYIGGGNYNDFWEYNPSTNTWTERAYIPGSGKYSVVGFSINGKGYILRTIRQQCARCGRKRETYPYRYQ